MLFLHKLGNQSIIKHVFMLFFSNLEKDPGMVAYN